MTSEKRLRDFAMALLERDRHFERPIRLIGLGVSNAADHHTAIQLELDLPTPAEQV